MASADRFARSPNDGEPKHESAVCEALRLIETKLSIGAWTWNLSTGVHHWTPGLYDVLNLDPAKTVPSREAFEQVIHPDDLFIIQEFNKALAEGIPFHRRLRILRQNGSIRWIQSILEVLFDRAGKPVRALGVVQDISEHHEEAEVERIWRDRYNALVKAVRAPIWTTRPDDPFTVEIENLETAGGASRPQRQQFLGTAWRDNVHPDDLPAILQAWDKAFEDHQPFTFEKRARETQGSYRWIRSGVAPILNANGSVRGWIGTSVDINAEKDWSLPGAACSLTAAQIRGARGILNWSVRDLADRAGLSPAVIRRLEEQDGVSDADQACAVLKSTFEAAGIEFLFPTAGKPGIRPA